MKVVCIKSKYKENKYVHMLQKSSSLLDLTKSGESGFAKPNHSSSDLKIFGRWINTEIIEAVNNVYKAERVFSHDVNAVFRINMFFGSINKTNNCKYIGRNICL
jgi:hypothetical protein